MHGRISSAELLISEYIVVSVIQKKKKVNLILGINVFIKYWFVFEMSAFLRLCLMENPISHDCILLMLEMLES